MLSCPQASISRYLEVAKCLGVHMMAMRTPKKEHKLMMPYTPWSVRQSPAHSPSGSMDHGPQPFVIDIHKATTHNHTYRTALWTGRHLQLTMMSIPVGGDIGLEMHPNVDQFLRIEDGHGLVQMGSSRDSLTIRQPVFPDSAIFVPAGTWHNLSNAGQTPLKLYSIYAPPNHRHGVVQETKQIAETEGH